MDKIDSPGSVSGAFTDGDPSTGTPATVLWAKFFNAVQSEILNVIQGAGITPSHGDNAQLLAAMNLLVAGRVNTLFRPLPQTTPNMTIRLLAGYVFADGALAEVATQNTPSFVAPSAPDGRIDRVVVDRATGALSVIQGTPSVTPSAPAIPTGKNPVAQVILTAGQSSISSASIVDERALFSLGLGLAAFKNLSGDVYSQSNNLMAAGIVPIGGCVPLVYEYTGLITQGAAVFARCDGSEISRATYAAYFAAVGTRWGSGNGSTTVNLPDMRGVFLRGTDHSVGKDPDRESRTATNPGGATGDQVGSYQDEALKSHPHDAEFDGDPVSAHAHRQRGRNADAAGASGSWASRGIAQWDTSSGSVSGVSTSNGSPTNMADDTASDGGHTPSGAVTVNPAGGSETRPKNVNVDFIVRIK